MNAITILAAVATVAAVLVPALAELTRISDEQRNPLRLLRVPTRRNQALSASRDAPRSASARASGRERSFGTEGEASKAPGT